MDEIQIIHQELAHSLVVIRAEIKDFLDAILVEFKLNYSTHDEPGITDFIFTHEEVGELGQC